MANRKEKTARCDKRERLLQPLSSESRDIFRKYPSIDYRPRARVPVLNFKHQNSDVPFDITVYTKFGKASALLLSRIKDMDIGFREVVLLVKGWAMCHGIHGASEGGFSSFALYMMVIFHFQTIIPRRLPPLSELFTSDVMRKIEVGDESWKTDFEINVTKYEKSRGMVERNEWDVYQVFYSFIKKFKRIRSIAECYYMSAKRGGWVRKTFEMNNEPLWIEEPFGEPGNITRSIKDVKSIGSKFKNTYKAINTGKFDEILENLAPQKLLELINVTDWNAIAKSFSREVGPKAVDSSDRTSLSSSAALIPQKLVIPAKTNPNGKSSSSSDGDVLGLGSYGSDDDEESSADVLGLGCYASDEDEDEGDL